MIGAFPTALNLTTTDIEKKDQTLSQHACLETYLSMDLSSCTSRETWELRRCFLWLLAPPMMVRSVLGYLGCPVCETWIESSQRSVNPSRSQSTCVTVDHMTHMYNVIRHKSRPRNEFVFEFFLVRWSYICKWLRRRYCQPSGVTHWVVFGLCKPDLREFLQSSRSTSILLPQDRGGWTLRKTFDMQTM